MLKFNFGVNDYKGIKCSFKVRSFFIKETTRADCQFLVSNF